MYSAIFKHNNLLYETDKSVDNLRLNGLQGIGIDSKYPIQCIVCIY